MKNLIIIGSGGHGKVVADIAALLQRYENICFLDDNEKELSDLRHLIIGRTNEFIKYLYEADFFVAIGNANIREKIFMELEYKHANIVTLIHPRAIIARSAVIGTGTVVVGGAVINPDAIVGKGCIINTCASVDHDAKIGNFVHVCPGARVTGSVSVGCRTWIGAGTVIRNNINIASDCMIGCGSAVVKDIDIKGTYIGVPARLVKV